MLTDLLVELSDFTIEKELGQGKFGKVYLVQEKSTQKLWAAKVSQKECKKVEDQKSLFQELLSYSKMKNPAIVLFHGFNLLNFKEKHHPTIIIEYMPNGSLDKLIERKERISSTTRYIILLGIAEGMKYLHSLKIAHRDLKPANVLLDENYYPHITDFGTAKLSDESFLSLCMNTYNGTPLYMAPEIINGEGYTYKIDIFSFAILAYEVITFAFPFAFLDKITVYIVQHAIVSGKRPDLSIVHDEIVRNLLSKCWSRDPKARPDFAEIVETIKSESFIKAMNADRKEIDAYLSLFGDKLPTPSEKKDEEPVSIAFLADGKFCIQKIYPSNSVGEILAELNKRLKKAFVCITLCGRIFSNQEIISRTWNIENEDDTFELYEEFPEVITIELLFDKTNKGKYKFVKCSSIYDVRYLVSILSNQDFDSICLEANSKILENDDEEIEEDTLIIAHFK